MFHQYLFFLVVLGTIIGTQQIGIGGNFLPTKSTTEYFANINSDQDFNSYFITTMIIVFLFLVVSFLFVYLWVKYLKNDPAKFIESHGINILSINYMVRTNAKINLEELFKYITIDDYIISVDYRSMVRSKNGTTANKQKSFYNCLKLISNFDSKKITFKIFANGNIQVFGCKKYNELDQALDKLFGMLKTGADIVSNNKNKHVDFIEDYDPTNLKINGVYYYRFDLGHPVNCQKLQKVFSNNGCESLSLPTVCGSEKQCIFKFRFDTNKRVVFTVYPNGLVMVSGLTNFNDIVRTYQFINTIVKENSHKILIN